MQDVTDLPFMQLIAARGGPDYFVTEYFRVHPDSQPEAHILRSLTQNSTGRPVYAQMIGQDIPALVRTARALESHGAAGIDLNLGCPAPIVCRKDAGGGLLRKPQHIDAILHALRDAITTIPFTVKCRLGFDDATEFPHLLSVFSRHAIDGLTIHARTVRDGYRTATAPQWIRHAVSSLPCPVIANGNAVDVPTALALLRQSGAAGLMIGRGAIRNPWLFAQLRATWENSTPIPTPTGRDMLGWISDLWEATASFSRAYNPTKHVSKMKKYLCYISQGMIPGADDGTFEHRIRRVGTPEDFHATCREFLDHSTPVPHTPNIDSPLFCGFTSLLSA